MCKFGGNNGSGVSELILQCKARLQVMLAQKKKNGKEVFSLFFFFVRQLVLRKGKACLGGRRRLG